MNKANSKLSFLIIILILSCEVLNPEPSDCAGIQGGKAYLDDCEQCVAGTTGLLENYLEDCLGICNGSATLDSCEVCDSNASNDCMQDCFGVWGGFAQIDDCGDCSSPNEYNSSQDDCGICEGDGPAENHNCDGICLIDDFDSDGICDIDESNPWGDVSYYFDNITDESVTFNYISNVNIYGFEFDVSGTVLTNVTSDLNGISLSSAGDNVLGVSLSGSLLTLGTGIASILYFEPSSSGFSLSISNIIFAGRNDELNAVELNTTGISLTLIPACIADCAEVCGGDSFADCAGDCVAGSLIGYLGDDLCDYGIWGVDLTCYECDNGDCEIWDGSDCQCIENFIEDCDGNCAFESWLGDNYCDDGELGIYLNCSQWEFDNGDCDGLGRISNQREFLNGRKLYAK